MKSKILNVIIGLYLAVHSVFSYAQDITGLSFEQVGKTIQIHYNITNSKSQNTYTIEVFLNQGNGWEGPLKAVSGAVGKNQKLGNNKTIVWNVLHENEKLTGNISFKIKAIIGKQTLTDTDGNSYKTVTIGKQEWMTENLKTCKYNDGTPIPLVTDNIAWSNLRTPAYCWYNNDQAMYGNTYGSLYNWYTLNTGKLCPTGWHVPSHTEWTTITTYLGGLSIAGGKLKEIGTTHWFSPNTGVIRKTSFKALPGGYRGNDGIFYEMGKSGNWWSATEYSSKNAFYRFMHYNFSGVSMNYSNKFLGYSVRCVRD